MFLIKIKTCDLASINRTFFIYFLTFYSYNLFLVSWKLLYNVILYLSFHRSKIKFQGKGYRLFLLKRNSIVFNFNYSHLLIYFFSKTFFLVEPKRYVALWGLNFFFQKQSAYKIFNIRYTDIFNGRGMRLLGRWLRRKDGKISLYR